MASNDSATNSSSEASRGSHDTARILSAKYLERNKGKKDLILRLRKVVEVLRDDENVEPDSADYPGLPALCQELVKYMDHRDKQVRLYTVSACMELFTVYAPDAPWSTEESLEIFRQTIRQLANLAHTTAPTNPHYSDYARILDLLAEVKIGVILVEMTKEEECKNEALPVLADLFRTLLQSVRAEHPPEIAEMTQITICGCLDEFNEGIMLPIPLLDEILLCIGKGPRVLVFNPQKAAAQQESVQKSHKRQLPAHQVEQINPSYMVASSIIRSSVDRLSTPIAALLNGLLNNDSRLVSESSLSTHLVKELSKPQTQDQNSQADVYNIIYELHRVAPSILTTVVGTLTNFLGVPEVDQRKLVIQLLGKLFVKAPAKFANKFRPCYRQWLERAQDKDMSIRLIMLQHLLLLILPAGTNALVEDGLDQISEEAQSMLKLCLEDPASDVRLGTIHGICDLAYRHPTAVSLDTWLAVGCKVTSKQKQERKDALTGLVQTYYQHYMVKRLKDVQAGGDDVPLDVVQQTLQVVESVDDSNEYDHARFEWIPSRVFECACWKDDTDLQSRVWQAMDDMLLGSELAASSKKLTSTARAVGLAIIVDSLEENALSWLGGLLRERSKLQQKLNEYMDARALLRQLTIGSTEHLTANANALDLLEAVASFTEFTTGDTGERNPVLERFHTAKDRHIFRILSTITTPTHSIQARVRAYDELPKRVKSLGDTAVRFVKGLVRKCSMGDFLNQEIVHDSILLAQEFGGQGDWELCRKFLRCIELATDYFPEVCGEAQCFLNLTELFLECRSSKDRGLDDILTRLTSILAKAALKRKFDNGAMDSNLRKDLLRFCRDGTPEQARHAVKILISITSVDAAGDRETLDSLLASLASPSILSVSTGGERLVTILAALSELSEAAPETVSSEKGQKAVRFAFESVLLGRGQPSDEMDASDVENDDENDNKQSKLGNSTTPQGKRNAKRKHLSPGVSTDLLDDINLSQTCRKLCAAIGFLTSFARSTIFASMKLRSHTSSDVHLKHPSSMEMIEKLFDTLSNIVRDEGMPPSSHDRKECSLRQDRSALRQCAAINLLRLCDARLSLDHRFLTPARWHILAGAFLDDERVVRDKIMEELGLMLTGHGKYGMHAYAGQAMIPRFHFLALVALCTDSEHSSANGNAANVGKRANTTKKNALQCVHELRKKYEVESEQARANGPEAEQNFEMHMKVRLMPEYVVPYAFHLLAFRKETPLKSGGSTGAQGADDDSSNYEDHEEFNESQERVLRKRLKWLFDPLVLSLGDTADNISFLIRMSDKIAGFTPVGHKSSTSLGDASATARLTVVCDIARMVLMSYVKKDVNLATFPGQILVPGSLFQKASLNKKKSGSSRAVPISRNTASTSLAAKLSQTGNNASKSDSASASQESFETAENSSPQNHLHAKRTSKNVSDNVHTKGKPSSPPSGTHVHFSPDVGTHEIHDTSSFGALSPIERKLSMDGSPRVFLDSGEKTRGSTPPSAVRNMAFTTTASVRSSATITESPSSRTSNRRRSLRSRSSARVETQKIEIRPSLQVATQQGATSLDQERSKRQLSTKDDPARMKKTRKSTVPTQIKVVRHRPLQDVASSRRVMRKRTSRETGGDFDFDVEDSVSANMVSKQTRSPKTKENSVQPQMRPTKRRTKI